MWRTYCSWWTAVIPCGTPSSNHWRDNTGMGRGSGPPSSTLSAKQLERETGWMVSLAKFCINTQVIQLRKYNLFIRCFLKNLSNQNRPKWILVQFQPSSSSRTWAAFAAFWYGTNFTYLSIGRLIDWLLDRSIDWLIDWLSDWLIDWSISPAQIEAVHRNLTGIPDQPNQLVRPAIIMSQNHFFISLQISGSFFWIKFWLYFCRHGYLINRPSSSAIFSTQSTGVPWTWRTGANTCQLSRTQTV